MACTFPYWRIQGWGSDSPSGLGDDEWDASLLKANESRGGGRESTNVEIKPAEPFLEVNVEPLTACFPAGLGGCSDQLCSDT